MPPKIPSWYVDTCIFASVIKREEIEEDGAPRWQWGQRLLEKAEREEIVLYTSAFTLAELHGGSGEKSDWVFEQIAAVFDSNLVVPVTLTTDIAILARDHIWKLRKGKPRRELAGGDAIHLASAIAGGCSRLITWDGRDLIKLNGVVDGMSFARPGQVISAHQAELDLS